MRHEPLLDVGLVPKAHISACRDSRILDATLVDLSPMGSVEPPLYGFARWRGGTQGEAIMKRICLIALSSALVTGIMALTMNDASAARRGGINHTGAHAANFNRPGGAMHRAGVNRPGLAYRQGWAGNRVGWNGNGTYWNRPRWGLAATGLAIGAAAASAAYYGGEGEYGEGAYAAAGWDGGTSSGYSNDLGPDAYVPITYFGPICNPRVDPFCQ